MLILGKHYLSSRNLAQNIVFHFVLFYIPYIWRRMLYNKYAVSKEGSPN